MKKEFGLALMAFLFLSLNAITGAYALEEKGGMLTLLQHESDISGDGKNDIVTISGIPFEEGISYLKEIILHVTVSDGKTYKIDLKSGFDPTIDFIDLNSDGVADLFISIPTGGSGGLSNYFLYTLANDQLVDIGIPDSLTITSQFQDGYKATMTIEDTGETYTFDLKSRKKDYNRLGLYLKGKLNEPTELMVDPYSLLKPIKLKNEQYGLKGIQQISGAYHADGIAFVESKWYYENGKWNIVSTKVLDREKTQKKK
jgi:hypothetical protein